ncbi:MAG: hypothetical protein HY680_00010 [Chloroflexi bacterium]|nr:hypothetical protein [Chloroflexota bacterium]
MNIVPRANFRDSRDIPAAMASRDPRELSFKDDGVVIDLRNCDFVWPSAALWCVVYSLLARKRESRVDLLVPSNLGVCSYLASIGFFDLLKKEQIAVDDRGIPQPRGQQYILPLTRFTATIEVDHLINSTYERLQQLGQGSANLYAIVSENFGELAMNAVQHAQSPIGAFGLIQFYTFAQGERFVCAVADGGIGVRKSLEKNPANVGRVPYDWVALEYATKERVTGTLDSHRGIGLFGVAEDMRKPERSLLFHSGIGSLMIEGLTPSDARRVNLFPGTLASMFIPT